MGSASSRPTLTDTGQRIINTTYRVIMKIILDPCEHRELLLELSWGSNFPCALGLEEQIFSFMFPIVSDDGAPQGAVDFVNMDCASTRRIESIFFSVLRRFSCGLKQDSMDPGHTQRDSGSPDKRRSSRSEADLEIWSGGALIYLSSYRFYSNLISISP
jgi:hypothetical protein